MEKHTLTIESARTALAHKKYSARELLENTLMAIKERDKDIHAFISLRADEARTDADASDKRMARGEAGVLEGVPIAIKDNILVSGGATTAASRILENYQSAYDATVVNKLREAGAVLVGKTNLDEFAMGSSTENSAFGPTKNPHDTARVPGGSSGGSAAAVAAGMCCAALGSDTGGSIRQPASFCGVVGLKPTYGAVSRYGLVALASSLDQIGPLTHSVADARLLFEVIRGRDVHDATSADSGEQGEHDTDVASLTIGVPKEYFDIAELDNEVKKTVQAAIDRYAAAGATVKEVSIPSSTLGLATYYVLMPAEASSNLARYDGIRYGLSERAEDVLKSYLATRGAGFGDEPTRRSMIGTHVLSSGYYDAYYKKAQNARAHLRHEFREVFEDVDVLMTPTTPTTAFALGEKADDPIAMYAEDILTVPMNIAGLPALSLPCGTADGLPVGLQIIAPWWKEHRLFDVGAYFEQQHD